MIVSSIPAAAKALGVAERTVASWLAAGAPGKRGHYDVDQLKSWRFRSLRPAAYARRRGPARVDALVDVATRFAREVVNPDGAFATLLTRLPRTTRDYLAVSLVWYLFDTVEDYSAIDKEGLFEELGLMDAFSSYVKMSEKLGLD